MVLINDDLGLITFTRASETTSPADPEETSATEITKALGSQNLNLGLLSIAAELTNGRSTYIASVHLHRQVRGAPKSFNLQYIAELSNALHLCLLQLEDLRAKLQAKGFNSRIKARLSAKALPLSEIEHLGKEKKLHRYGRIFSSAKVAANWLVAVVGIRVWLDILASRNKELRDIRQSTKRNNWAPGISHAAMASHLSFGDLDDYCPSTWLDVWLFYQSWLELAQHPSFGDSRQR
ncbi:hypothetical protein CEK25_012839 [Fusarium fujikuroi]|nr:hypothetical protein CEK25_012839 [Fusarium fujikuroi]